MGYKKIYRSTRRRMRARGVDPAARDAEFRKWWFFHGSRISYNPGAKRKRRKGHWPREQPPRSTTKQNLRKDKL